MQRSLIHKATILGFLVLFACDDSAGPEHWPPLPPLTERDLAAPFQTDSLNYMLVAPIRQRGHQVTIAIQYMNTASWPVELAVCDEESKEPVFFLDRDLGDGTGWNAVYIPRTCTGYDPVLVSPGGTYADTFTIWNCPTEATHTCYPHFLIDDLEGDYRFHFYPDLVGGGLRDYGEARSVSNVFRLHMPRHYVGFDD